MTAAEREMLAEHGTQLMALRPSSIVATAREDLRRFERNRTRGQGMPGHTLSDGYEPYAFHRKHVRKVIDVPALLALALSDPEPGLASGKYITRMLYADPELLRAAMRELED